MKELLITILSILYLTTLSAQTTYYVSTTGSDTNNGLSETTAWQTIGFSASSLSPVSAGDTVYIKAGDYGLDDVFIEKNYSPSDARISFIGYQNIPDDINSLNFNYGDNVDASIMPLINPNDRTIGDGVNLSNVYSISIKNIQIANSLTAIGVWNSVPINSNHRFENIFLKNIGWEYSTALGLKEANGNSMKNCLIVNATGAGMDIWGNNNLIDSCQVYSNESQITPDLSYTSMDYYIVLKGDSNTISNCYAERVGELEDVGHGLEIKESGEHNLFVNCTVKNMIAGCFSVRWQAVQNNEFRNCKAIGGISTDVSAFMIREGASSNVFNNCISDGCNAGVRFILAGEDANYCGEYNTFNNCIIKNADWVIDLNPYYYNSANADNNLLVNCTIDHANYLYNCERPNNGNQFINCAISNIPDFLIGSDTANFTYQYCNFYNNGFSMPTGAGNISSDPQFVDQLTGDYHLQITSPCIDAGTLTNAPTMDFDAVSRPQGSGIDIGAYEYITSTNSMTSTNDQTIVFYPNPTAGIVYFDDCNKGLNYQLFSASGKVVQSGTIDTNKIDLTDLTNGVYFLKIETFARVKIIKDC